METNKTCSVCHISKNLTEFYNGKDTKDGKYSWCCECHKAKCKKNYYEQIEKNTIQSWKKYGIKSNDYNSLFNLYSQATHCYLCDVLFEQGSSIYKKCLDHDHSSGYPRFICCHPCNIRLSKIDKQRKDVFLELHRYYLNNFEKIYLYKNGC